MAHIALWNLTSTRYCGAVYFYAVLIYCKTNCLNKLLNVKWKISSYCDTLGVIVIAGLYGGYAHYHATHASDVTVG